MGAGEGSARFVALVVSLAVARVLGPAQFGGVALAQAVVLYFAALGDGGLTVWTQRQIVLHRDRLSRLVTETVSAQLLLGALAVIFMCAIGLLVPLPHDTGELVIAASPFGLTQALTTMYALQAVESMRSAASVRLWTQIATAVLTIGVLGFDRPVLIVVCLWAGQFLGAAYSLTLLWRRLDFRPVMPSANGVRLALRSGLSLLGAITAYQYIGLACTVMLGVLGSNRDVGYFSAASRPILLAPAVFLVLGNALYPEMIRRFSTHPYALGDFLDRILRMAIRGAFAAALLIYAAAQPMMRFLYGASYDHAVTALRILGFLFPLFAILFLSLLALTAAGMTRQVVVTMLAGAFILSVSAPILIRSAHTNGCAWAMLAAHVAISGLMLAYNRRFQRPGVAVDVIREIAAGAVGLLLVLSLSRLAGTSSPLALVGFVITALTLLEVGRGYPTMRAFGVMAGG